VIDQLAKTDRIDVYVIASYAATIKPEPTPRKSKKLTEIRDLLVCRRQIMQMRTQELNRVKIMGKSLIKSCEKMIQTFDKEIRRIENTLDGLVELESEWAHGRTILNSALGVGPTLTYSILSELPEIGTLTNRQIAKLVGVAPMNHDNSMSRGKR